ncbi:MAG: autoinducer binding domain-containing protein [Stenotrophobium sp.]
MAEACGFLSKTLGFSFYLLSIKLLHGHGSSRSILLSNFPKNLFWRYKSQGYHTIDPISRRARQSTVPFLWDELHQLNAEEKLMMSEMADHGLRHGLSATARSPNGDIGLLCLASPERPSPLDGDPELVLARALLCATISIDSAKRVACIKPAKTRSGKRLLSQRERQCLGLSASGLTTDQIAKQLGVTASTVRFHIDNCLQKFGVRSRGAAISQALILGELEAASTHHLATSERKHKSAMQ